MKKTILSITALLALLAVNNYLLYHFYIDPRLKAGLERNMLWEAENHLQQLIEHYTLSVVSIEDERQHVFGSGFFITQFGHIVTTTNFPPYRRKLIVRYADEEYSAAVLSYDTKNNIALLKIPVENSPKIPFARYKSLRAGSFSIALGNPAGTGLVIEPGIVKRNYSASSSFLFIETSSMVNNGNNGGPLIDAKGKIIGINFMTVQPQKNPLKINYAIPVDQIIESVSPVIDINEYI